MDLHEITVHSGGPLDGMQTPPLLRWYLTMKRSINSGNHHVIWRHVLGSREPHVDRTVSARMIVIDPLENELVAVT